MFYWSGPTRKNSKKLPSVRQRTFLHMEPLEGRDCPSASPITPQITAFSVNVQTGNTVLLSGTITDSLPTAARVSFGGVASGLATPDASGHFQLQESLSRLGMISATVQDPNGSVSNTSQVMISDPGMSLSLSVAQGPNRTVTVTGQVSSSWPTGGLTVTLSGVVAGSVTTSANGTFTYTETASALGEIQAKVTDAWGVTVTSSAMLNDNPPTIVNFQAIDNGGDCWTLTGQVQGGDMAGGVVTLGGIPSLNNVSVPVQADGSFFYTVTLQPGEHGEATAECIDDAGQASNVVTVFVGI
jgi:hypothetical protein